MIQVEDNFKSGWIKLFRSIEGHWLWPKNKPLTQFEAWIMILIEVNHIDEKVRIGNDFFTCKRGEKLYSLDTWAALFCWNKSKVRRFFDLLHRDSMIVLKSEHKTTRITVCNYDTYQGERNADETQMKRERNADETQMTPIKECKELKNEKNKEYKNILLSKIDIFDFPELKFEYLEIALSFQELFKSNLTEAKASTVTVEKAKGSWIDDVRMMVEVDKVKVEDLREIFKFLKKDQFWKQNILSTKKLREKYPQLKMKINGESKQTGEFASKKQSGNRVTDAYKQSIIDRIRAGKPDEDVQNN